jgi:hypothetical protein
MPPTFQGTGGSHLAATDLGGGVRPRRHEIHGSDSLKAWAQNSKEWVPAGVVRQTSMPVGRASRASCWVSGQRLRIALPGGEPAAHAYIAPTGEEVHRVVGLVLCFRSAEELGDGLLHGVIEVGR